MRPDHHVSSLLSGWSVLSGLSGHYANIGIRGYWMEWTGLVSGQSPAYAVAKLVALWCGTAPELGHSSSHSTQFTKSATPLLIPMVATQATLCIATQMTSLVACMNFGTQRKSSQKPSEEVYICWDWFYVCFCFVGNYSANYFWLRNPSMTCA